MTFRRILFWSHLTVGVVMGLVILSMCATGMILSFQPQITAFAERGVRQVPTPDPGIRRLGVEALIASASRAYPEGTPTGLVLESDPSASAIVRFGREGIVYINPYTGEVLGKASKLGRALDDVETWHRWLGDKKIGGPVTGAAAIAFLGMAMSGLFLWWPRNWTWSALRGATLFKSGLGGKAKHWNRHTVIGFWCAPYLILITVTGIIMSYTWANNLLYTLTGNKPPAFTERKEGKSMKEKGPAPSWNGMDTLWARAEQQVPAWRSINIRCPTKPDAPIVFFIQEPANPRVKAYSQLTLDRESGEVVKWQPYNEANQGLKLRSWVTPLHTGRAWGLPGQLLNFLVATGGIFLIWTGFAMAWQRFFGAQD